MFPLIWCGVAYSLGSKFRQSVLSNRAMLTVWGAIFLARTSVSWRLCSLGEPLLAGRLLCRGCERGGTGPWQ